MIFWILISLLILLIYKYLIKPLKYWEELKVPFVKPKLFFGNSASFIFKKKNVAEWSQDLYNSHDARYVGIHQFTTPSLIIKDLNLIKQLTIKDFDHFEDRRPLITEEMEPMFGKNLVALQGNRWRHMRATLSPAFTGNKMRSMFILMSECSEQLVNYFQEKVEPNSTLTIELKDVFTRFANDIIASTAFGIKCDSIKDADNEFYVIGKEATNLGVSIFFKIFCYNICSPLMRLFNIKIFSDKICNFFRNIVVSTIKYREEHSIVRPDMIHLLMEARKGRLNHEDLLKNKDETAGFATVEESHIGKDSRQMKFDLSNDDITAQAFLFFMAGFDSVSNTMCHASYELAINQDIQQKLQYEIDTTLDEYNGKLTYDALVKMKYMDMVLSELLRKWPGGPFIDRICTSPYTIPAQDSNEVQIELKKNDIIVFPFYAIQRDPKYFPNPEKFDPERFNDENRHKIQPFSYLPFGAGPRNCIGSRFALLEVKILLFYIFSTFSLVLVEKSQVPIKLSKKAFSMSAENGFWIGLKLRERK